MVSPAPDRRAAGGHCHGLAGRGCRGAIGVVRGKPDETISTRCGGQGVVAFFGMAKPVKTPLIGPARPY